jgi:hypothetical protein
MKATAAGLLVLAGLSTTAQADEPRRGTLTLACTGTRTDATQTDAKPEPVSMGITIDFNTRAVAGFGSDGIVITDTTEMILTFGGSGVGDSTFGDPRLGDLRDKGDVCGVNEGSWPGGNYSLLVAMHADATNVLGARRCACQQLFASRVQEPMSPGLSFAWVDHFRNAQA